MTIRRRACRVDCNQRDIIGALRACGAMVHDTSAVGGGFPDLVVIHNGERHLVEVKDGKKSPSRRAKTDAQEIWHADSARHGYEPPIVNTIEDALAVIGYKAKQLRRPP